MEHNLREDIWETWSAPKSSKMSPSSAKSRAVSGFCMSARQAEPQSRAEKQVRRTPTPANCYCPRPNNTTEQQCVTTRRQRMGLGPIVVCSVTKIKF